VCVCVRARARVRTCLENKTLKIYTLFLFSFQQENIEQSVVNT